MKEGEMFKRVGVLALMVCGGAALLHPTAAMAQDYRGWNGHGQRYYDEGRSYRDGERFRESHREREWREHERREWRERAWREREWREHERRENGWYPAPRGYYGYQY
jgi:hypothetical protein